MAESGFRSAELVGAGALEVLWPGATLVDELLAAPIRPDVELVEGYGCAVEVGTGPLVLAVGGLFQRLWRSPMSLPLLLLLLLLP